MTSNINRAGGLGKGEVVSSILTGSTRKPRGMGVFIGRAPIHSAVRYGTRREHNNSKRGKSVDSVHGASRAEETPTMTVADFKKYVGKLPPYGEG